jgi:serine/threonine protein kinase
MLSETYEEVGVVGANQLLLKHRQENRLYMAKKFSLEWDLDLAPLIDRNVVQMKEKFHEGEELTLILELCEFGDMDRQIAEKATIPEYAATHILAQCCQGLLFFADAYKVIKPANVFVNKLGEVKVGDFAFSREKAGAYNSPELVARKPVDGKSNVWSLGATIYHLVDMKVPFPDEYCIAHREPSTPSTPTSQEFLTLMMVMLQKEAAFRPSAEEILSTELIKSLTLSCPHKNEVLCTEADDEAKEFEPEITSPSFTEWLPLQID